MRPLLLDLFCGAGGASMGYYRAGFEVVGVDINPQPDYPFDFHQCNALEFTLDGFDAIHASPPCQLFTRAQHLRKAQGNTTSSLDLVDVTRQRLVESGLAYVIENVPGAPLVEPARVCGSSFGLKVRRHRMFEANFPVVSTVCDHKAQGRPVGVYHVMNDNIPKGGRTARNLEEGQEAMGIDWMPWKSLKEAIPPAYTEWVGRQLMETI